VLRSRAAAVVVDGYAPVAARPVMMDSDQDVSWARDPAATGGVFSLAGLREADDGITVPILPRANVIKIGARRA
jgi:hypothetical protein